MEILESLAFLHLIGQICCLSPWQYLRQQQCLDRSRPLETYTACVLIVSAAFLFYGIFSNDDQFMDNDSDIGDTVDFIQMIGIRVAHIVCLCETLLQRHTHRVFYEKVCEIDKIFKCALNMDINNRKFRKKTLQRAAIMLSVYMLTELFILITKMLSKEQNFPLFWLFYLLPLLICGLRYFQVYTAVNIIKRRFDKLINILVDVNLQTATPQATSAASVSVLAKPLTHQSTYSILLDSGKLRGAKAPHVEEPAFRRLLVIRDLYNRLWELTDLLNRSFGISILINVGNDFISITSNCYWIFLNFKEYSSQNVNFLQIAGSAVWSVPHLFNVLLLAIICERTTYCSTRMALSLHRMQVDIMNENHNTVIEQFSLQLLHQKLAFTAAGFFNIDCTLLYTIVGATTTYLIILIQFHLSEVNATNN